MSTPSSTQTAATARTQPPRARLTEAIVTLAAEQGYANTTVADIIARARASRKTFYEHFPDKQACLLAAADQHIKQWLSRTQRAVIRAATKDEDPCQALTDTLLTLAHTQPATLNVLIIQLASAGQDASMRREQLTAGLAHTLTHALTNTPSPDPLTTLSQPASQPPSQAPRPSLSANSPSSSPPPIAQLLAGAILRVAHNHTRYAHQQRRRGRRRTTRAQLKTISYHLAQWARAYAWLLTENTQFATTIDPVSPPPPSALAGSNGATPPMGGRAPGTLCPIPHNHTHRRGLTLTPSSSRSYTIHNQRERLIDAVANLSAINGYQNITIPQIVTEAAVSVQAFYKHFQDRDEIMLVALELGNRKMLTLAQDTYLTHTNSPNQIHATIGTIIMFLATEPAFAHLALIDALTAGPQANNISQHANNAYQNMLTTSLVLHQHQHNHHTQLHSQKTQSPNIPPPTHTATEASINLIKELCCHYATHQSTPELTTQIDLATQLLLTPFPTNHDQALAPAAHASPPPGPS